MLEKCLPAHFLLNLAAIFFWKKPNAIYRVSTKFSHLSFFFGKIIVATKKEKLVQGFHLHVGVQIKHHVGRTQSIVYDKLVFQLWRAFHSTILSDGNKYLVHHEQ